MQTADQITESFARTLAPNASAFANAQKISRSGGFIELHRSTDGTLLFGTCKGSGSKPYYTSADFCGTAPVFRCSCPSRQFPCKHGIALLLDWLARKEFSVAEIPEDILRKREKLAKKAISAAPDPNSDAAIRKKKAARSTASKKLQKQLNGLEIAEQFACDLLTRGISSINQTTAAQYRALAKQLGDYYLPEPQAMVLEIIAAAEKRAVNPDDTELERILSLCVKLFSAIRKSRAYITSKLACGEVLPEDSVLYEAMGNVWKLTQLKEIGLYKENARLCQLSFTVLHDAIHKADVDFGYWVDLDSGEISKTKNIRPLRAARYVSTEDSAFGMYEIPILYRYPGGLNRRVRWNAAEQLPLPQTIWADICALAEHTIGDAVKKAKNELKNTLSDDVAAVLMPFSKIGFAADGHGILTYQQETISLEPNNAYPDVCQVLSVLDADVLSQNGAVLGELFYRSADHRICFCPITIMTPEHQIRLC